MTPREIYVLLAELVVGYLLWPLRWAKRWRLRYKLRRKMRLLGMIPMLAILWAGAEVYPLAHAIAQVPGDSLIGTTLSRSVIGNWNGGKPPVICCLTVTLELDYRPRVLFVLDAELADMAQQPVCPNPRGGFFPVWLDLEQCPSDRDYKDADHPWVIVRCGQDSIARHRRRTPEKIGQ